MAIKKFSFVLGALLLSSTAFVHTDARASEDHILNARDHVVYIESNETKNTILAYKRDSAGKLTLINGAPFSTNGKGVIDLSLKIGPFDTDQNLVVDRERRLLFAVNSGSNTIAVFHINPLTGALRAVKGSPFPSGGINPVSVALRGDQIVILNQNNDPAQVVAGALPTTVTRHVHEDGRIVKLARDTTVSGPAGSSPSQVLADNVRPFLFRDDFLGGLLQSFQLSPSGALRANPPVALPAGEYVGTTAPRIPLGLWASPTARQLYVGLLTISKLGVYTWDHQGVPVFQHSVPSVGSGICWLRTNKSGTRLYASNTGLGTNPASVSVYDTSDPANPVEIQNVAFADPGSGFQVAVDPTGKFVYVIKQRASASVPLDQGNSVHVFAVNAQDGKLTEVPSSPLNFHLETNARPQGLAIY